MPLLTYCYQLLLHERAPRFVLTISLLLTAAAWYVADSTVQQRAKERFDFEIEDAKSRIIQRMANYEQVLRGGVALFEADGGGFPNRQAFRQYVATLNTNEYFPGIQGIGFAQILKPSELEPFENKLRAEGFSNFSVHPAGPRDMYSSILYLEPMDKRNLRAFGYDMYSEPTRHAAMDLARDTGKTSVSGRVILVQETKEDVQAGFLMYLPVYRQGMQTFTTEQRRAALLGFVYSPFRARDLMTGILGQDNIEVEFSLYDGDSTDPQALLFDSRRPDHKQHKRAHIQQKFTTLNLPNRQWSVIFHTTDHFAKLTASNQPMLIAVGGIIVDFLLYMSIYLITRNRNALQQLADERGQQQQRSEANLAAIVTGSDDAIISKNLQGIITSWNKGAEKLFGYSAAEIIGQPIYVIVPDDKISTERTVFIDLIKNNQVQRIETVHKRKDGSLVEIAATLSPIYNQEGDVIGVSKIARDISERKRIETNLALAKESADAANRAKSDFLANMSHEIRTPMNGILGLGQLLASTHLNTLQREYLNNIQVSARNLLAILNDILDYSKIEAGKLVLENIEFDLDKLLFGVTGLFTTKASEKDINLNINIEPDMPNRFCGDPLRISQILNNLISNAIKFTEKGNINLSVRYHAEQIFFSVKDTGIGIQAQHIPNLFQAFQQADNSTSRKFGGTGLGLSICKRLVRMMGGDISVHSTLGLGSEFKFHIHITPCTTQSDNNIKHNLRGMRALIADDDSTTRLGLQQMLQTWGVRVITYADGQSALNEIQNAARSGKSFDLIFLDWQMPGLDGVQVARRIRQSEQISNSTPYPLLLMVSAFSKEQLIEQSQNIHIDAFMEKPLDASYVLNMINHILNRQRKPPVNGQELDNARENCQPIHGKKILLVEDNEINQLVAASILDGLGMHVDVAENGRIAVEMVKQNHYDLIFMDLQMPIMDGFEATKLIRKTYDSEQLPIIAMTAAAMEKDRSQSSQAGMNDHIAKPIDIETITRCLLRWLN